MNGGEVLIRINGDPKDFEAAMNKSMKDATSAVGGLNKAFAAVTVAGVAAFAACSKVGMSFEAQMSTVEAISGATGAEMQALTAKAKQMGIDTKFSATEAGQALEYMAMAGWKSDQMLNGIEGVMNLAAASGENLAGVSDIVTDALTAFGLQAEQSTHFADVLAQASASANTNVGLMGESFKYCAPIAGALKYSVEDTAVAIGLMANAGIKGSQAGTAMRSMLTRLVKPTKQSAQAMSALGLSVTNSDGTMKSLKTVMDDIRKGMSKLTDAEKTEAAASLAGQEAMSGMLAIVNASESDYAKLTDAISKADGAAKEMAETKLDNLQGSVTLLKSSAEGLGIAFYDKFGGMAKEALDGVIEKLNTFSTRLSSGELDGALKNIATGFVAVGAGIATLNAIVIVQDMINVMKGYAAVTKTAAAAQQLMSLTNPYTLILTGVAALTAGVIAYTALHKSESDKRMEKMREELDSYHDLKQSVEDKTTADLAELQTSKNLYSQLEDLVDANGRVKDGQQERVDFILGELNAALDTEYKRTGDIIENYDEMKNSIDEVIQKKQAMILIENAEESYKAAQTNYTDALKTQEQAYADLAAKVQEVNDAHKGLNLSAQDILSGSYSKKIQEYADTYANLGFEAQLADDVLLHLTTYGVRDSADSYSEASDAVQEYSDDIQKYNDAVVASSEGRYSDVAKILDSENKMYANAADVAAQQSGKSAKELAKSLKDSLSNVQNAQNNLKKNNNAFNQNALKGAQEVATGMFDAYLKAGGNAGTAVKQGLVSSEAEFYRLAAQLGTDGAKQIYEKYPDFYQSGVYTVQGIIAGAASSKGAVVAAYGELGAAALKAFNKECKIKSPSRVFMKSSYWNVMGLVKGVEKYEDKFTAAMKSLAQSGIQAFSVSDYGSVAKKYLDNVLDAFKESKTNVQKVEDEKNKVLLDSEKKYQQAKKALDDKRDEEKYQEKLQAAKDRKEEVRADYEKRIAEAKKAETKAKYRKEMAEKLAEEDLNILKVQKDREKELRERAEDEELESLKKQAEYERDILEATEKDVENAKDSILSVFKDIAEESFDSIEEVYENVEKMRERLSKVNITREVKFDFDGKTESYTMLSKMGKQKDELIAFGKALDGLKAMGNIPKEIVSDIASMDVSEGLKTANAFLKASPYELSEWLDDYNTVKNESARISSEYYKDDIQEVVDEVTKTFDQTPEEFFEIGKDSVEQFGKGFMDNLSAVWRSVQSSLAVLVQQSFPEMFGGGKTDVTTNYSLTVNGESRGNQDIINQWSDFVTYDRHMQKRGEA